MHLQQTKRGSRISGGPQYYFHDVPEPAKLYLRSKGAVGVALVTPYGAAKSHFIAVSANHKLDSGKVVRGKVGHDRIQSGRPNESIGEAIRHWYSLRDGDFERVDLDVEIRDDRFYLTPVRCYLTGSSKPKHLERVERPLTFSPHYVSPLWRAQIEKLKRTAVGDLRWAAREVDRVCRDHETQSRAPYVQEVDLLRAAGALDRLGVELGPYVGRGFDCATRVTFLGFPTYDVPFEIKRNSSGFVYQQKKYGRDELSRAVILCALHSHKQVPPGIDVIELRALAEHLASISR